MGRQKRYDTMAEKQKAYRARKKTKGGDATCESIKDQPTSASNAVPTVQPAGAAKLRDEDVGGMLCVECGGYETHVDGCSSFPVTPPKKHWVKDQYSQ